MNVVVKPDDWQAEGITPQSAMLDMQRRMVRHVADGATTDFAESSLELPSTVYTDPARLALEKRELFLKQPMLVSLSSDIPGPGDVMLFDAAGPSIVITRAQDGRVHAFLNSCRHRMGPVVRACSNRKLLTCPFHGWTYDLQGRLVAVPGEAAFPDLDKSQMGLVRVPVGEWAGMIFVKAHAGDEEIDVQAHLGPLGRLFGQLNLADTTPITKTRVDLRANWKFGQDTFFEGYHFATLHPETIATVSFSNVAIHDAFERHQRVMMPSKDYIDIVEKDESEWPRVPYQGIHLLFPNAIFFVGHVETFHVEGDNARQIFGMWRSFPGETPDQSFTLMSTYSPRDISDKDKEDYAALSEYIIKVIKDEDYALCEEGQKNLNTAPAGSKVTFGRNEVALQSIHREIAAAIGEPL